MKHLRSGGAKYIIVDRHGSGHWSLESASSTACVSVRKSTLVEWTEYLIDNVYIKVGNSVYRQTNVSSRWNMVPLPPGPVHKWRLGSICYGCFQETCRSHL